MDTLRAGASVVDITAPVGVAMGGYGARTGVSEGIHDPLHVRTLVLDDGATKLVLAICDFVGVGRQIVEPARAIIERDFGIPPQNVAIAATHTHSGPLAVRTAEDLEYATVVAGKVAGSVRIALQAMQPVSLKIGRSAVTAISQNRRDAAGPIETALKVLLAAGPADADPVATLLNYACHATVLEHDNLLYSADFPGAAAALVERALGGTAIYMQGACGDVNPAWMRHDFAEVRRVGGIVGSAGVRTANELRPLGESLSCINLSWSEEVPVEPMPGTVLDNLSLASATAVLELPRKTLPPLQEIEAEIASVQAKLAALPAQDRAARRSLMPRFNQLRVDRGVRERMKAAPGATQPLEVQAFRLSPRAAIAMLPGEFFVETGHEIERRAGFEHLFVCAYANDYAGYFAPRSEFPKAGYEVGSTRFEPGAAEAITEAAVELLTSLRRDAP